MTSRCLARTRRTTWLSAPCRSCARLHVRIHKWTFFSCSFDTFSYQRDILKALNKFLRETELEKGAISLFWTSKILLHRHLPLHHQLLLSSFFSTPSSFLMKSSVPENRLVLASQFFFHDKHFSLSFDIWTAEKRPPCETKQIVKYVLHSRHFIYGNLVQWI